MGKMKKRGKTEGVGGGGGQIEIREILSIATSTPNEASVNKLLHRGSCEKLQNVS